MNTTNATDICQYKNGYSKLFYEQQSNRIMTMNGETYTKQQNALVIKILLTLPHTFCADPSPRTSTRYIKVD